MNDPARRETRFPGMDFAARSDREILLARAVLEEFRNSREWQRTDPALPRDVRAMREALAKLGLLGCS
jgi:hypothetical protein